MASHAQSLEQAQALLATVEQDGALDKSVLDAVVDAAFDFGLLEDTRAVLERRLETSPAHPADKAVLALKYAIVLIGLREFERAINVMEQLCADHPADPKFLINLCRLHRMRGSYGTALSYAEQAWDMAPGHVESLAELGYSFGFADQLDEFRARFDGDDIPPTDRTNRASCYFDLGAYAPLEQLLAGTVSFLPPSFLHDNTMPIAQLAAHYPELDGHWPEDTTCPVYFMACDQGYFDIYAKQFAHSVGRLGDGRALHLHVYNPARAVSDLKAQLSEFSGLKHVSVTTEQAEEADKVYFSSVRFIRFAQLAARHDAPIVSMDADSLVVQDVFGHVRGDIIGFQRPEHITLKLRFYAAFLMAAPTPAARRFLEMLASFIGLAFKNQRAHWYVDQMGLLLAHRVLVSGDRSVQWTNLTHTDIQYQHLTKDALVWAGKGPAKTFPNLPDVDPV